MNALISWQVAQAQYKQVREARVTTPQREEARRRWRHTKG